MIPLTGYQQRIARLLTTAASLTPSMRSALNDLRLDRLWLVHAGESTFPLAPRVLAVAARELLDRLRDARW